VHSHNHTYISSSYSSLDWVLFHWAHFTVCRYICVYVCVFCMFVLYVLYYCNTVGEPDGIEAYSLGLLSSFSALTLLVGSFDP